MATSAQITAKCAEIAQQMNAQTELMRRLAAASARLAVTQPTSARGGAIAQPEQRRRREHEYEALRWSPARDEHLRSA
jgi:primosomal protein N''